MEDQNLSRRQVEVYLDDGRIFIYTVESPYKAREHASAIVQGGYRHNDNGRIFEHYPPHRIAKVKITGGEIDTRYPDSVMGT